MKIKLLACSILIPFVLLAQSNSDTSMHSGIIYGIDHSFKLTAPSGWVLDNSSGVSQGIHAVFYPIGGSWENSKTVMYTNTASKKVEGNETIEKVMEFDLNNFKQRGAEVIKDTILILKDNKRAILKYFEDNIYGNYEVVAYIDEETIITLIILSSRDEEECIITIPKFIELLNSYMFLTKSVDIGK